MNVAMKIAVHWAFCFVIIRYCMCAPNVVSKLFKFRPHPDTPARLPLPYAVVEDVPLMGCCSQCNNESVCFAINYHAQTNTCELVGELGYYKEYYSAGSDGWKVYSNFKADTIYQSCATDGDCLEPDSRCIQDEAAGGTCFCKPLFQYKDEERSCKQVCDNYGNSFTKHPGYRIPKYRIIGFYNKTVAACKEQCLKLGDNCQSFNKFTKYDNSCYYISLTKYEATVTDVLTSSAVCDLYTKNCEPVP